MKHRLEYNYKHYYKQMEHPRKFKKNMEELIERDTHNYNITINKYKYN